MVLLAAILLIHVALLLVIYYVIYYVHSCVCVWVRSNNGHHLLFKNKTMGHASFKRKGTNNVVKYTISLACSTSKCFHHISHSISVRLHWSQAQCIEWQPRKRYDMERASNSSLTSRVSGGFLARTVLLVLHKEHFSLSIFRYIFVCRSAGQAQLRAFAH